MIISSTGCLVAMANAFVYQKMVPLQKEIANEVVRFHIRANSDEDVDQQIKLKVKDAIVEYLQPILADKKDVQEAKQEILVQMSQLEVITEQILQENAFSYEAKSLFKKEYFPEKQYGDYTFPAGTYEAVVICLGSGQGQNWWCMLYPGLCFVNESYAIVSEETGEKMKNILTEDAFSWITEPKKRKWGFRWAVFQ